MQTKCTFSENTDYVPRKITDSALRLGKAVQRNEAVPTLIIPEAVEKLLQSKKPLEVVMVYIMLQGRMKLFDKAIRVASRCLGITAANPVDIFDHFIGKLPPINEEAVIPMFVFDIDEQWKKEEIRKLIVFAKKWGADTRKARFVLVLSAAI
jgi:hypothetical protein